MTQCFRTAYSHSTFGKYTMAAVIDYYDAVEDYLTPEDTSD